MTSTDIIALPARVAAERLASGALTAVVVAEAWLEAVSAREPEVQAFAYLDPAGVLEQARTLDASSGPRGVLHGIPLGVKDIMETVDQPTGFGSPIYGANHRGALDAACVALAREAGAIIFGKTVTTEFATYQPGKTRNPHNLAHTPGGSSSGAAAAVAAGMLPLAFGTQTGGSVIRPAAFCGVVGYKPSFGLIPRAGVKPLSESLDTIGIFARDVADAAFAVGALLRRPSFCVDEHKPAGRGPLRIGLCRTPQWPAAAPETVALWDSIAHRLSKQDRVEATEMALPPVFDDLVEAQRDLMDHEAAWALSFERAQHRDRLSAPLRAMLDRGWAIPPERYDACHAQIAQAGTALSSLGPQGAWDVLLTPSAPGEAPAGLDTTGDPIFNRIWTALGVPCVHLPLGRGPRDLPLGLQVIGPVHGDAATLAAAYRLHPLLAR